MSRSSTDDVYRSVVVPVAELTRMYGLLEELSCPVTAPIALYCDNQAVTQTTSNPIFHERTKHIEIDCHFVREKVFSGDIITRFVLSSDQLLDIFTSP